MTPATTAATPATTAATSRTRATPETTAPRPDGGAVGLTLDPVTLEDFLAEHWERRPLTVARAEPGRFDGILSAADVERLVTSSGIRMPAFRLVRDGAPLPASEYTQEIPWRPGSFAGLARVDRVAEEHAAGATIVLQALQLHWHPAAHYCRGLEQALGFPVQANAYATPAGAQGFAVHHDTHDVFVLQISGTKRWRIYAPVLELPLSTQRWSPSLGDPGAPVQELTMEPGDTLYVPRGWPHEAVAQAAASLHLTIGLHPPTRLDALRAALDECAAEDVEFRRGIGDGTLPPDLVERLAGRLGQEAVAGRARRKFVDSRRPVLDDQLTQVSAVVGAEDAVERRPTVIAELEGATLRFEGKEIAFPDAARKTVAALASAAGPVTALDLPGDIDEASRLVVVRRLIREGFLRTVR